MAFFDSSNTVQQWYYKAVTIRVVKVVNDVETTICDLPIERLISFHISEDFEAMYFPLFSVTLAMESHRYYEIMKNKDSCKLYLRIDKFARNDLVSDKLLNREFINGRFEIIVDKTDVNFDEWLDEKEDIGNYMKKVVKGVNNPRDVGRPIQFYLFPEVVGKTKKNVNKVFNNRKITDSIAWIYENSGINNLLMSEPDNKKVYSELVIPPLSTIKALSFIDTYYGVYKPGSILYFGLWYNYFIPYDGKNHVLAEGESTTDVCFLIPKYTSRFTSGNVKKSDQPRVDYIMTDSTGIDIINASISNDYIVANNIESIETYDNLIEVLNADAKHKNDANFIRYFENRTENEFLPYAYVAQTNAMSDIVTFTLTNTDISVILPHKRFNVLFEDSNYTKDYTGNYILSSISTNFASKGMEFSPVTTVVLKKSTIDIK